jgi:hypothetical protein
MTTPVATTFYSHRIFLSYEPKDYRDYLMEIVNRSKWDEKSEIERNRLELGLLAWGTILVYRARMVPFHFSRELKRLVDESGKFIERDPATPLMRSVCRQQLTMQLGIEAIIRRDAVKERIHEVPVFQQYAYDTLYWPSYQHEKGLNDGPDEDGIVWPFVLTRDNLKKYLWFRAKGNRRVTDENFPPADITTVLFRALDEYLQLLQNPESIRRETINYALQLDDPNKQRLWTSLAEAIEIRPLVEDAPLPVDPTKKTATGKGAVAATQKAPDHRIGWQFCVDRFGVRFGNESLQIEYARKAVRALMLWTETIESLFGDLGETMVVATNAYLLPQYPYWTSISEAIEIVQKWLGPDHAGNEEVGGPPVAGSSTQPAAGRIVNARTQDYVYQLQLYLEAMRKWAPAFSAATWVASLAGTGSAAADPRTRLLQGLKTVASVYEFDSTTEPTAILERFAGILGDADQGPDLPVLQQTLEGGRKVIQHSAPSPDFAEDPAQFYQWLKDWATTVKSHPHYANAGLRKQWKAVEDSYWRQWSWPSLGAVSRWSVPSAAAAVSPLDLIYTARYGAVPLLHWRGGTLSICQWSRIMAIASERRVRALEAPVASGLGNLGFEPANASTPAPNSTRLLPIGMISPQSERSPAWTWRPDPTVRAFAILPRLLAESDKQAALEDRETDNIPETGEKDIKTAVEEAGRDPYSTCLHFIEIAGGQSPEVLNEKIPNAYWRRVGFGFDGTQRVIASSVSNPRSVGELVELTKNAYPELFPRSVEAETPIARFLYRVGRIVRVVQIQIRRQRASIVRVWRMLKRTYTSFVGE